MSRNAETPPPSERWFVYLIASLVPIALAGFLPGPLRIPLAVVGAGLMAWGLVLVLRQPPVDRKDFET